ncbi:MAG: Lrp/AsnC family transcriptional regulator [Candidatus Thorarchaeota archaeon]
MINETYGLDEIDKRIVTFIQKDPSITYTQIAKKVSRSQPTVGTRIKKLEESGILKLQAGLNLKNLGYYYAKIELQTSDPEEVIRIIKSCPYMIHGYRVYGISNFLIIIAFSILKNLDKIVNFHFRINPNISVVKIEIISEIINEFVIPIDLESSTCNCIEG